METTAYEIKKLGLNVLETRYEDFVKDPRQFIADMMQHLGLAPSANVEKFMQKISVQNRNARSAKSAKTEISNETKKKILEIVQG